MGEKSFRQSPLNEAIERILQQRSFSSIAVPSNSINDLTMKQEDRMSTRPGSAPSTPRAGSQAPSLLDSRGSKRSTPIRQIRQALKRPSGSSSSTVRRRNSAHSRLDMWSSRPGTSSSSKGSTKAQQSGPLNVTVSMPGYVLSRSPSRVSMKIDPDKFFGTSPHPEHTAPARTKSQVSAVTEVIALQKALNEAHEESMRIQIQLQEELADQTYTMEKEREKHAEEFQKQKDDFELERRDAKNKKSEEMRTLQEEHQGEVEALKMQHKQEIAEQNAAAARAHAELNGQLQFLQETFDSYKSSIEADLKEKWERQKSDINEQHIEEMERHAEQAEQRLEAAKTALRIAKDKEHKATVEKLQDEHDMHIKRLEETCEQAAESLRELDRVTAEVQNLKLQNESMEVTIEQNRKTIRNLQGELGETKRKLSDYENHFTQKVAEVEDKYRGQIHGLMTENTQLRRRYMKKCDDYYHLQAEKDTIQRRQVRLLEQKMQVLTEVQMESQSQVSLATQDGSLTSSGCSLVQKKEARPTTAPPESPSTACKDSNMGCIQKLRNRPKTCSTPVRTRKPETFR
ncbi:uncharacterized protein LOC134193637 isoform X2 [Corticium candelabrum]|uniref:uncharacterized protein LOC134193637 isoform X2 n=1 Tax=Corticium candelabrum TaxID=121492 RepID=UPI002E2700B6|nr:uncharacterized protein LOC134193637 isoform X2 [Corticium candelabrum]